MLSYDFEESVSYWVCMTSHLMHRALNEELAPHGITYRQWQVLAWLAYEGSLSQADLAERMEIEPATLVSVLSRMERDGWVIREDCPHDRRKRIVSPTAQAEPVWERGAECARRVRTRATIGMTGEEVAVLRTMLGKLRDNLLSDAKTLDRTLAVACPAQPSLEQTVQHGMRPAAVAAPASDANVDALAAARGSQ